MRCGNLFYHHKDDKMYLLNFAREFGKYESEVAKNTEYTVRVQYCNNKYNQSRGTIIQRLVIVRTCFVALFLMSRQTFFTT